MQGTEDLEERPWWAFYGLGGVEVTGLSSVGLKTVFYKVKYPQCS